MKSNKKQRQRRFSFPPPTLIGELKNCRKTENKQTRRCIKPSNEEKQQQKGKKGEEEAKTG